MQPLIKNYRITINRNISDSPHINISSIIDDSIKSIKDELHKNEKQLQSVYEYFEQKLYDVETFNLRNIELSKKKMILYDELQNLVSQKYKIETSKVEPKELLPSIDCDTLDHYYDLKTATQKNQIFKAVN